MITTAIQAQTTAALIGTVTQTTPEVVSYSNGAYRIFPKQEDVPHVQNVLRNLLNTKKAPSLVQVDYQAAVTPVLIEKYGGVLLFSAISCMMVGYSLKRRK